MEQKKHAALYIRVSTDAQAEEGYSIEAQQEDLIKYCELHHIDDYECYIDGGWSGSNLDRPEMQRLIADIHKGTVSHCIVFKLDRLSRSQKDTLYLIEDVFKKYDVYFVSLGESMDTATPTGMLIAGVLSALAQMERENIKIRTRRGMLERVKAGYWMGGGVVPFGYDYDRNQGILVPNKDADTVRKVYDLYLKGYAAQAIANMLDLKYDHLAMQILTRKTNYGVIEYKGVEYQGRHEPLISKETYDLAMAEMAKRSVTNTTTATYLLTGLVYCGKCGAKMRYQKWGKRGAKLVCYSQQHSKPYLVKDPDCDQQKYWADEVERDVIHKMFMLNEQERKPAEEDTETAESMLLAQKDTLEKKIRKLYNLYVEAEADENADSEILNSMIKDDQKKLVALNKRINLERKKTEQQEVKYRVQESLDHLEERWQYMSGPEKQATCRTLIEKVTIKDDKIEAIFTM